MQWVRRYAVTIAVAMVTAAVTAAGPAIAHGVGHALFAHEADEVDGRDAVGAGANIKWRAGKLVATKKNGFLPNDIIQQAPDSDLLDGLDSGAFAPAEHGHDVPGTYWASSYFQDGSSAMGSGAYTFISVTNVGTATEGVTLRFVDKTGTLICETSQSVAAGATWTIHTGTGGGLACVQDSDGRMEVRPDSGQATNLVPWGAVIFPGSSGTVAGFTLTWAVFS